MTNEHKQLVEKLRNTVSVSKREMLDQAAAAIEQLSKAVAEEHERFVRYADYSVQRDRMIEQLKKDLLQADETGGCIFCLHALEPMPCEAEPEADYICNECPHNQCLCGSCRGSKNWEWRGIVEDNRVESDTDKLVEIDRFTEGQ